MKNVEARKLVESSEGSSWIVTSAANTASVEFSIHPETNEKNLAVTELWFPSLNLWAVRQNKFKSRVYQSVISQIQERPYISTCALKMHLDCFQYSPITPVKYVDLVDCWFFSNRNSWINGTLRSLRVILHSSLAKVTPYPNSIASRSKENPHFHQLLLDYSFCCGGTQNLIRRIERHYWLAWSHWPPWNKKWVETRDVSVDYKTVVEDDVLTEGSWSSWATFDRS